jgi:ABC-type nitrate/sulfonate/bicarbonate transport system substrate-binding protein
MKRRRRRARPRVRLTSVLVAGFLVIGMAVGLLGLQPRLLGTAAGPVAVSASDYVLKFNGAITPSSAGVLMAISDALFQREGLTLRLLRGTGDADVISAVADNDHEIGLATAEAFLKARAEGLPIVAIAASFRQPTAIACGFGRQTDRLQAGFGNLDNSLCVHCHQFHCAKRNGYRGERSCSV